MHHQKSYELICCQDRAVLKTGRDFAAMRAEADAMNAAERARCSGRNFTVRRAGPVEEGDR